MNFRENVVYPEINLYIIYKKVREPETVASHMFRMGFMGVMFSHKER